MSRRPLPTFSPADDSDGVAAVSIFGSVYWNKLQAAAAEAADKLRELGCPNDEAQREGLRMAVQRL